MTKFDPNLSKNSYHHALNSIHYSSKNQSAERFAISRETEREGDKKVKRKGAVTNKADQYVVGKTRGQVLQVLYFRSKPEPENYNRPCNLGPDWLQDLELETKCA